MTASGEFTVATSDAPTPLDVFVSYNTDDRILAERVVSWLETSGLRAFFDRPGPEIADRPLSAITVGMKESRAILIMVGPNGLGTFQKATEIEMANTLRNYHGRRVVVLVFPGTVLNPNREAMELLLQSYARLELAREPSFESGMGRLYELLMDKPYLARRPVVVQSDETTSLVDVALSDVTRQLRRGGLTIFLGPRVSPIDEQMPPRSWEIASNLLQQLDDTPADARDLWLRLETVGPYFSTKNGEDGLEEAITSFVTGRCAGVPRAYELIASLLRETLARRAMERSVGDQPSSETLDHPQLIVSTNLDLMMERALLREAVPFVRVVQYLGGARQTTSFADVERAPNGKIRIGTGSSRREVDPTSVSSLDHAIMGAPRDTRELHEFGTGVVLYKYHGSLDAPNSFTISIDHFINSARTVNAPKEITKIISTTACLFIGFGILTADFAYLYYTLLEEAFAASRKKRYALQLPPDRDPLDHDRRLDRAMWLQIKSSAPHRFRVTILEDDTEGFLERLRSAAAGGRPR